MGENNISPQFIFLNKEKWTIKVNDAFVEQKENGKESDEDKDECVVNATEDMLHHKNDLKMNSLSYGQDTVQICDT